jgi:hypothetical protein
MRGSQSFAFPSRLPFRHEGRKENHPPGQLRVVGFEDQLNFFVLGDFYGGSQAEVFVAKGNALPWRRARHHPNFRGHGRILPH